MSTNADYLAWKAAAHVIHSCKADAVALQEINLAWD